MPPAPHKQHSILAVRASPSQYLFLETAKTERQLFTMVRKVNNVYAICAFAAIGGGLFGFDISSMSGVLGTSAYKNYFNNPQGSKVCLYSIILSESKYEAEFIDGYNVRPNSKEGLLVLCLLVHLSVRWRQVFLVTKLVVNMPSRLVV